MNSDATFSDAIKRNCDVFVQTGIVSQSAEITAAPGFKPGVINMRIKVEIPYART